MNFFDELKTINKVEDIQTENLKKDREDEKSDNPLYIKMTTTNLGTRRPSPEYDKKFGKSK